MVRSPPLTAPPGGMLRSFQHVPYRYFWSATVLWNFTRWMDMVVIGWVVLELTNSAFAVALIGFYRSLPLPLFGILGGVISDRFDRRSLIRAAQIVNATVAAALCFFMATGTFRYEHAVVANLLFGFTWAIEWPARRSLVPDLVGRNLIVSALGLEQVSMNLTKILGPLLGGAITAYVGAANAYALIAIMNVAQIVLLTLLVAPGGTVKLAGSVLAEISDAWRATRRNQPVMAVLIITVIMNCLAFPFQQILPVIARDGLQTNAFGLGVLGAANGFGALFSSLVIASRGRFAAPGLVFGVGSTMMCVGLTLFAISGEFVLSATLLVASGFFSAGFGAFQSSIILLTTPDALRGRVMGMLTIAIGSSPLGLLEMGALAEAIGAGYALAVNTALCATLVVIVMVILPGLYRLRV